MDDSVVPRGWGREIMIIITINMLNSIRIAIMRHVEL